MHVRCRRTPFEFAPVREFLDRVGYRPSSVPEQVAHLLVRGTDGGVEDVRAESHLTDATTVDTQLRYFTEPLVRQRLFTLAAASKHACRGLDRIEIEGCEHIHEGTALFFHALGHHLPSCRIEMTFSRTAEVEAASDDPAGRREAEVASACLRERPLTDDEFVRVLDAARTCTYVGDYHTSERLARRLARERFHVEVEMLLGVAANATLRPFEAEYHFGRVYAHAEPLDRARACYSLAMLAIRHHASSFRDLDRGEAYLQEAYEIIVGLDPSDRDAELAFRRVFNRNGLALVWFKRGRVREALASLDLGIARLRELAGAEVDLHHSVLEYNRILCLRALGDTARAEASYRRLLDLDPTYPYYPMDWARWELAAGRPESALLAAQRAREIDPYLATAHSLMGRAFVAAGDEVRGETSLARAAELEPVSPYHICSLASLWNRTGRYERTRALLSRHDLTSWDEDHHECGVALLAQAIAVTDGHLDTSLALLESCARLRPDSPRLEQNLALLRSIAEAP